MRVVLVKLDDPAARGAARYVYRTVDGPEPAREYASLVELFADTSLTVDAEVLIRRGGH